MSPNGINYTLLSSQMHAGDSLLTSEAKKEHLPTLKTAFNAHLTLRAIKQGSSALCEKYTSFLHDRYGLSWEEIGLIVVDKRVYDLAMQIVLKHLASASDTRSREAILHCIPIQHYTDGRYDLIVPALLQMHDFPGQRSGLYGHAISLITCVAQRDNTQEVIRRLAASGLLTPAQTHVCGAVGLIRM